MIWKRDMYISYLADHEDVGRTMFCELFGPLKQLEDEWRAQGASEDEISLEAFGFDSLDYAWAPVNNGIIPLPEREIERTSEYKILMDSYGRKSKLCFASATIPLPMGYPVETPEDWEKIRPRYAFSPDRVNREKLAELRRRRDEFEAATGNMTEGLVLLNEQGSVLSINRSATHILDISRYCIGKDIRAVSAVPQLRELSEKALGGEHCEAHACLGGVSYRLYASPVTSGDKVTGAVLLMLDTTEKEQAEQLRREFSANVSHELKSPLHTISGCAELLANGIVKPEDVPHFLSQIQSEAKRMIALIEDIIKLSHLDEGAEDMQREDVDLLAIARRQADNLSQAAESAEVSLSVSGESAVVNGIPQLLDAIVHNLCENAIKYNRPGGFVKVNVRREGGSALLTVEDNGIGIPPEQQERIFERFYRVDKSHSKEVGGTGLGLSIVKHAAALHNAKISVASAPGKGTVITVLF